MNAQIVKDFSIIAMLLRVALCILIILIIPRNSEIKEEVDISVMGEEMPKEVISLNPYIPTDEVTEIVYILGDKGNIYELYSDSKGYHAKPWHPEFWAGIKIVDLCAGERLGPNAYVLALDEAGNVYIWNKEYESKGLEWGKKTDWHIQRMENIPEVAEIYAGYYQFALVTREGSVYSWNPIDNANPGIDNMEMIDLESPVLSIVSLKEELLILDRNHVLWCIENGVKKVVWENVKNIMQSGKGFVVQMMNDENTVYVYNSEFLQKGYETLTLADKYEVSKISFESGISLVSVSSKTAVACVDEEKLYKWGKKEDGLKNVAVPGMMVYERPVEVNVKGTRYYTLIGKDAVYIDEQDRMFVVIPY